MTHKTTTFFIGIATIMGHRTQPCASRGNVSKHSSNPKTNNVLDIAPSSVKNSNGFINTLKRDKNKIQRVITPRESDPAIHIEINQIKKYY